MHELTRRTTLQRGGMLGAILALNSVSPALAGATPTGSSARFKAIDAALREGVSRNDVAGVVATAATRKGMIYEGAFGKANVATGASMTLDTVFWLLSMTKAFTATACMQLIEQGRLHLDDDAAKYLPELASPQILEGFADDGTPRLRRAKGAIKVRHLLTHTSGYTYSIWSEALTRYEKVTGMPDIATCKNAAFTAPLEFEPGERWEYGISMDWAASWSRRCPTSRSRSISARTSLRRWA
ncbi:CubicO group peptidase (beta-lactamase class C family) [Bradyrhizobium liaoningense]